VTAVLRDAGEDDDSDVYVLGLRESTDEDAPSLLLMECHHDEDEEEIALGMDTYCLVVDPGQATSYGGVRECDLVDGVLRLRLTVEAAEELGLPVETTFELALDAERLQMVRRGLSRVLRSGRADARPARLNV
jgi:hypothetical protein